MRFIFILTFLFLSLACNGSATNNSNKANNSGNSNKANSANNAATKTSATVPIYTYEIVKTYKHDPTAFTEGLFYQDGFLYESTGEEGKSSLRKVELETGKVVQKFDLPKDSFGEGISLWGDKIYQLTWKESVCRVFDAKDFKLIKEIKYAGDGWGMTNDGKTLIMTDSTHVIRFVDP